MLQNIDINKLHGHNHNPRKDLGDLTELTESIKQNGILQNLTVVPWYSEITGVGADDPKQQEEMGYIVIIGHRRLAAAKQAGLKEVPCIVSKMTQKEQLATMLMENMQREDLTVYEQAQGFQMMLDLGETVKDISRETGLSDTTVRRRVKLLDLDQEKFKESESRNVTLQEYASLEKIEDLELRNEVLDYAGTPNFNNKLKQAIEKEKSEKRFEMSIEKLREFATEIEDAEGLAYVESYAYWNDVEAEKPEDIGEEKYFYTVSSGEYWNIYLYKESTEEQGETEEERIKREKREELEAKKKALDEMAKRARELRLEFAKKVSNTKAKENLGEIVKSLMYTFLESGYCNFDYGDIEKITGKETKKFATIAGDIENSPERHLFITVYGLLDNVHESYRDYWGRYEENEDLDRLYDLLENLGYEMSDEEKAMQDGSHELYEEEE